ncbi:hypothetical protein ABPG75_005168 [Micractinium tetrahymenae]
MELERQAKENQVEFSAVDVSAPGRTLDVGGRQKLLRQASQPGGRRSVFCLPVLSPLGAFASLWLSFTTLVDLTYTAFFVPLSLAFNSARPWMHGIDLAGSLVYFFDLLLGFHIGYLARWDGRVVVVQDGRAVARRYVWQGTFLFDLLANLPSIFQLCIVTGGVTNKDAARVLYLLRLLRIFRVFGLLGALNRVDTGGGVLRAVGAALANNRLRILTLAFSLAVALNLMGCIWWLLAAAQGVENSWAAPDKLGTNVDLETSDDATRWLWSVYYAMETVTTIGYGDITPTTTWEVAVSMLFMLIGAAYFGYILSTIGSLMDDTSPAAKRSAAIRERLQEADSWMRSLSLPLQLERDIRRFYAASWEPELAQSTRMFDDLPRALRLRVATQQQQQALKELSLLPAGTTPSTRKAIRQLVAAASTPRLLRAGEQLWRRGEEAPFFCILDEGELLLEAADGSREIASPPAVLGISALFGAAAPECRLRQHAVRGLAGVSKLWAVDAAQLAEQLRAQHPLALLHFARHFLLRISRLVQQLQAATAADEQARQAEAAAAGEQAPAQGAEAVAATGVSEKDGMAAQLPRSLGVLPLPPTGGGASVLHRQQLAELRAALLQQLQAMEAGMLQLAAALEKPAAEQAAREAAAAANEQTNRLSLHLPHISIHGSGRGSAAGAAAEQVPVGQDAESGKHQQQAHTQHQARQRRWLGMPRCLRLRQRRTAGQRQSRGTRDAPGDGGSEDGSDTDGTGSDGPSLEQRQAAGLDVFGHGRAA